MYLNEIDKSIRGIHHRVRVTKAQAKAELERMPPQRTTGVNAAVELKKNIENGTFIYIPGQAVHYDEKGELRNGAHRFSALVMTNKPDDYFIEVDVATQTTTTEIEALDQCKPRQTKDILTFKHNTPAPLNMSIATIGRAALLYDCTRSILTAVSSGGAAITTKSDEVAYIEGHCDELTRAATFVARQRPNETKLLTPKIEGLMYLLFARVNESRAAECFVVLGTGAGLEACSPLLVLRNRLTLAQASGRRRAQRVTPKETAIFVAKTWNALQTQQHLKVLTYSKGEDVRIAGTPMLKKSLDGMSIFSGTKEMRKFL